MQSFTAPRSTTNPYLVQLMRTVDSSPDVTVATFGWTDALLGRFDVLHLHWPELLARGSGPIKTRLRWVAFALLLLRIRIGRKALVRTLHNLEPHERAGRWESALYRWCDRSTTLFIRLNDHTPLPVPKPGITIPHGHYRDWYRTHPSVPPVAGRLLYFGLVRPYKGLEQLTAAFHDIPGDAVTLRLVGDAGAAGGKLRSALAAGEDARFSTRLEYLTDADLAAEIGAAEVVVLPYRQMHNSGAAILALSLGRPVLVPDNEVTSDLADEMGPGWVIRFDDPLDGEALADGLRRARARRSGAPDMSGREWELVASRHIDAYRCALRLAHVHAPGKSSHRDQTPSGEE